jgi:hypothetical protein
VDRKQTSLFNVLRLPRGQQADIFFNFLRLPRGQQADINFLEPELNLTATLMMPAFCIIH